MSIFLIVVGAVLFLAGLGKSGGFSLRNFGINFGGKIKQANTVGNVAPAAAKETKPDWAGLAIAGIGLLTALFGWLKG
jgi:hypothetical protein